VKVLVVDDAAANRLVLSALLKRIGHEVVAVSSVEEALSAFPEVSPDALLTDLHMPDGDEGLAVAREIRKLPRGKSIRLALMTGDAASFVDSENLFDAILDKPVLAADLSKFLGGIQR